MTTFTPTLLVPAALLGSSTAEGQAVVLEIFERIIVDAVPLEKLIHPDSRAEAEEIPDLFRAQELGSISISRQTLQSGARKILPLRSKAAGDFFRQLESNRGGHLNTLYAHG